MNKPGLIPDFSPTSRKARIVSPVTGAILVTAAFLKAQQWAGDPYSPGDLPPIPSLRAAAIDVELALGIWLLSGLYPRAANRFAAACFAVFLGVASRDTVQGKASCCCFGNLVTPPWLVAIFDLTALGCLLVFVPQSKPRGRLWTSVSAFCFIASSIPLTFAIVGAGTNSHLMVRPHILDFGSIKRGGIFTSHFTAFNPTSNAVEVGSLETGCHCLTARLERVRIQPGQDGEGEVILDTGLNPNFTGRLKVEIHGYSRSRQILFTFLVEASVNRD